MKTEGVLMTSIKGYKEIPHSKSHAKTMPDDKTDLNPLSQDIWQKMKCCNRIDNEMKCEESLPQSNMGVDKTSGTFETECMKCSDAILNEASLLSTNERAGVAMDLNNSNHLTSAAKLSCTSQVCQSAHLDSATGSHSTNSLLSQPATSIDHTQTESVSHCTIEKDTMSVGQQSSASCSSFGAQATGHRSNEPSGARPKLVATKTTKMSSKSRNGKKKVRWSEETQHISSIDATTYEHCRKCLLELSVPTTVERNAAIEAVHFMSDKEPSAQLTLVIDMVFKFLWAKQGACPNAMKLYSAVCDFEYDEKNIVAAFHEMCQTTLEKPAANDEQLHSLPCPEEPLRALDFQNTEHISQVDNNYSELQPYVEERHETSETNKTASMKCSEIQETLHKKVLTQEQLQREQLQVLLREQENLKASMKCVLCRKNPIEITLLPCGHFVLCAACSKNCNICPVCNKQAIAEVKTFLC